MRYEILVHANLPNSTIPGYCQQLTVDNPETGEPLGWWAESPGALNYDYFVQAEIVEADNVWQAVAKFREWQLNGEPRSWLLSTGDRRIGERG